MIKKPEPPLGRHEREGDLRPKCPCCKSSLKRRFWIFILGCINPECPNYWRRGENNLCQK